MEKVALNARTTFYRVVVKTFGETFAEVYFNVGEEEVMKAWLLRRPDLPDVDVRVEAISGVPLDVTSQFI